MKTIDPKMSRFEFASEADGTLGWYSPYGWQYAQVHQAAEVIRSDAKDKASRDLLKEFL